MTNRAADRCPPCCRRARRPSPSRSWSKPRSPSSLARPRAPAPGQPVQPTKQAAYDDYLFGKAAEAIAADKSIKIGTVYNYLSEAVDRAHSPARARFEEDLGGPHVFAAAKRSRRGVRSGVRKVLDVEGGRFAGGAHDAQLALRDADAMAAQAAGADHAAAVVDTRTAGATGAPAFSDFAAFPPRAAGLRCSSRGGGHRSRNTEHPPPVLGPPPPPSQVLLPPGCAGDRGPRICPSF